MTTAIGVIVERDPILKALHRANALAVTSNMPLTAYRTYTAAMDEAIQLRISELAERELMAAPDPYSRLALSTGGH